MTTEYILKTIYLGLLLTCSLSNARSVTSTPLKRNVATANCPTPTAPPNGNVDCQYADALQIEIFCTITCKDGFQFERTESKDFVFPCYVPTGFYDKVITPDCIPATTTPAPTTKTTTTTTTTTTTRPTTTTSHCPTPTAPSNGEVVCEYSDEIFCTITCKNGFQFERTDAKYFQFPCDVTTGVFDKVITPDCIHIARSTLVPPLG
ncbi:von Willebrand factor A domain-containing protein 2 [Biomphalaria glabrata]|nr:von Willebrand factor A domain-containing protein 2-like [Biomphalaria glabrata]